MFFLVIMKNMFMFFLKLYVWLPRKLKNQEHTNMEHIKSKDTNLQNTKTFKDSKHKEHKPKPNHQSPTNPGHHMKNQTVRTNIKPRNKPINFKTRKIRETNPQIRETHKQTQKF